MAKSGGTFCFTFCESFFAGNVTGTLESHTSPAGKTNTVKTLLTLDQRGVVLREEIYADGDLLTSTDYSYDELMRPVGKSTGSVSETFAYDIRGWQTGHTAIRSGSSIYSETLRYMNPTSGSTARWTGLISESVTQHYGATPSRSDSYGYDAIGRLISSNNENNISYDANGNVRSLRRISATGTTIANLTLSYNDKGNRLQSVTNIVPDDICIEDRGTFTYTFDSSGNLTSDSRNRLQIQNNVLNLPMRVNQSGTMGGTGTMTYTYLGDGTRAAARAGTDAGVNAGATSYAGKRYRGTFVYDVTAGGVQSLESVAVSTGRLIALTGTNGAVSFESDGFITDHLGNVAVVVNLSASSSTATKNAILEQNEYTPFGTKLSVSGLKSQAANRWRYAGKEEQDIAGMNLRLLDFGARYYDSFTCRWNAVDPMASSYLSSSPYVYCNNSPVNIVDPTGMNWYSYNGDYLWVDSTDDAYTDDNGNTWTNVGSSVSIDLGGGIYQNWFENVGFQSSKEFDAEEYILSHNLVGDYLSSGSDLCDIGKQELYKDYINYGRKEFLDSAPAKVTLTVLGAVFAAGLVETVMVGTELVSELEEVYRVYGGDSRLLGRYWSPNNPEAIPNYRSAAGLPNVNKGTNLAKARVRKCLLKSNGKAKPLDGNPGGGISEYLWETPRNSSILWTKTLNPPY